MFKILFLVENASLRIGTFNVQSVLPNEDERLFRVQARTIEKDLSEKIDSLKNDLQNPNLEDRSNTKRRLEATQREHRDIQDEATRRQTVNRIMRRKPDLYNCPLTRIQKVAQMIGQNSLDILVLCESMLDPDRHKNRDLQIDGFAQPFRFDRRGAKKASGGLLVYCREGIVAREVSHYKYETNVQYLHIEIIHPVKFHLVALYSPNTQCFDQVQHAMKHFINGQKSYGELGFLRKKKVIFIGDLNVDPAQGDSKARQYFEEAKVMQLITEPTHNKRCIDHILAYNFKPDNFSEKRVADTGIEPITHKLSMCKLTLSQQKKSSRKERDEIESSESSVLCQTCGRYFKGERGLAIHKGHARRNGTKCADSPSRGEREEIKSSENSVLCQTCGQYFKGEH